MEDAKGDKIFAIAIQLFVFFFYQTLTLILETLFVYI